MTETTDIAALWRQSHSLRTPDQTDAFIDKVLNLLEAERQRADAMQSERDEFRRRLKLERSILEDADKELAALKGGQVPVAVVELNDNLTVAEIRGDIPRRKAVRELYEGALVLGQELFTAPQKLVVLIDHIKISEVVAAVSLEQNRKWNGRVGYMAGWNACVDAAIAGGIVKDGE